MIVTYFSDMYFLSIVLHGTQYRVDYLGPGFVSVNIDFWTDPHRKDGHDCIVVDEMAERYDI